MDQRGAPAEDNLAQPSTMNSRQRAKSRNRSVENSSPADSAGSFGTRKTPSDRSSAEAVPGIGSLGSPKIRFATERVACSRSSGDAAPAAYISSRRIKLRHTALKTSASHRRFAGSRVSPV